MISWKNYILERKESSTQRWSMEKSRISGKENKAKRKYIFIAQIRRKNATSCVFYLGIIKCPGLL